MFEKISFMPIQIKSTIRSANKLRAKHEFQPFQDNLAGTNYEDYFSKDEQNVDFAIEGSGKSILPLPISAYAKKHLLFLQVFTLFDAGPSYYTKRDNYPYFLLLYTYSGKGYLEYEGKQYELPKGQGCVIDCRLFHTYYTYDSHWEHAILHFDGNTAGWLYQQLYSDGTPLFTASMGSTFQSNLEQTLLLYQTNSPYREYKISMQLEKLFLDLIEEKNTVDLVVPDYISYLKRYLECNFSNELTLDALAKFAGVSKYHLDREFKKYVGLPVNSYLIELRLNNAKILLENTNYPVNQIGTLSGFSGYPNFLKLFKARMNMTPNQYRKSLFPQQLHTVPNGR